MINELIEDIETYVKEAGGANYRPAILMLLNRIDRRIRQQVGKELKDPSYNGWEWEDVVDEVCKMEKT